MRYTASAVVINFLSASLAAVVSELAEVPLTLRRFSLLATRGGGEPKLPARRWPLEGASPADSVTDVTDLVIA